MPYADLGDIQQNIFSLIIKITFVMDFLQIFRNAYSGLKECIRIFILPNCTSRYENIIVFSIFLAISFAPTACSYRQTLYKLMSKFCDQY